MMKRQMLFFLLTHILHRTSHIACLSSLSELILVDAARFKHRASTCKTFFFDIQLPDLFIVAELFAWSAAFAVVAVFGVFSGVSGFAGFAGFALALCL